MAKERVDVLAYKQGLFDTREQAKRGVMAGLVVAVINGERFDKPGEKIDEATELKLKGEKLKYVSRGGLKLEKALNQFGLSVEGKIAIDIGASTGGFTDVMLQNGASQVFRWMSGPISWPGNCAMILGWSRWSSSISAMPSQMILKRHRALRASMSALFP